MAITKWDAAWTDRGTVIGTELNSLAAGGYAAGTTEIANQTNLDRYGKVEITVTFGSSPTVGGTIIIYQTTAPDGTNYDTVLTHRAVAVLPVASTTTQQRISSYICELEPAKTKFSLTNNTSQAFPASGTVVKLYTQNDETA